MRGNCLCGDVSFELSDGEREVYKCHCSLCRKVFGGASSAVTLVPERDFQWLGGADKLGEFELRPSFRRRFCPRCGVLAPLHLPEYGAYWVPAGLLEDSSQLTLVRHIHVDSKASWEVLDEHLERLAEGIGG